MDYWQVGPDLKSILEVHIRVFSILLLVTTAVSIKICLVVTPSYSKDAGLWDLISLYFSYRILPGFVGKNF